MRPKFLFLIGLLGSCSRKKTALTKKNDNTIRLQATKIISLEQYEIAPKSSLKFVKIHDKAAITVDLTIRIKGL